MAAQQDEWQARLQRHQAGSQLQHSGKGCLEVIAGISKKHDMVADPPYHAFGVVKGEEEEGRGYCISIETVLDTAQGIHTREEQALVDEHLSSI
eukprot:5738270-Lingulodinium_polyedra.AAC.1